MEYSSKENIKAPDTEEVHCGFEYMLKERESNPLGTAKWRYFKCSQGTPYLMGSLREVNGHAVFDQFWDLDSMLKEEGTRLICESI